MFVKEILGWPKDADFHYKTVVDPLMDYVGKNNV